MDNEFFTRIADIHSHTLPRMDDGAESSDVSLAMLQMIKSSGVSRVVASPHFYPTSEPISDFFKRRDGCVGKLLTILDKSSHPQVFVGAEVAFFDMIGHAEPMKQLTVSGTKFILVEMPFRRWEKHDISELLSLRDHLGLTPIIAHIERYAGWQKKNTVRDLHDEGVLFQCNGELFLDKRLLRKFSYIVKEEMLDFIGSDAHNMDDRKPNVAEAIVEIRKNFGNDLVEHLEKRSDMLLQNAKPVF